MSKEVIINKDYSNLLSQIAEISKLLQHNATIAVNTTLVETYWHIGKYIVEFEQKGNQKAEYGEALIDNLSKDLSLSFWKGFSRSNLIYMRLFYSEFQISQKASDLLSWSHYVDMPCTTFHCNYSLANTNCIYPTVKNCIPLSKNNC